MPRYFSAPRRSRAGYDPDDWNPLIPSLTVDDHVPIETGLIDHRGDPIMRAPNPVGFHHPKERA
jgi:hypothetical protein